MNSTSPSSSLVRIAARSPARSSAGPGRDVQVHAHLGGDDAGQRGLAEPGRAGEQQVVDGLAAPPRGLEHDREVLLELALADELGERPRPQPGLDDLLGVVGDARVEELVTHGGPPAACSASRSSVGGVVVGRQLAQRLADLVGAVAEAGQRLADVADRRRRRRRRRRPGRAPAPTAGS